MELTEYHNNGFPGSQRQRQRQRQRRQILSRESILEQYHQPKSSFSQSLLEENDNVQIFENSTNRRRDNNDIITSSYRPPQAFTNRDDGEIFENNPHSNNILNNVNHDIPIHNPGLEFRNVHIYDHDAKPINRSSTNNSYGRISKTSTSTSSSTTTISTTTSTMQTILSHICPCCQCLRTNEVGIVENFGKFDAILPTPGFHCIPWPFLDLAGRLSLRVQLLEVACETRTLDAVFCHITVAVSFRIIPERTHDAYYRSADPGRQMESHVFDVLRKTLPHMTLDEAFLSKTIIADSVREHLAPLMLIYYGYEILHTFVIDLRPDDLVVQSMNQMNASKRLKEAMVYKAEADKIEIIKRAEANAERAYLSGVGTGAQRKALAQGFQQSVHDLTKASSATSILTGSDSLDTTPQEIMDLLLVMQYMDTLLTISNKDPLLHTKSVPRNDNDDGNTNHNIIHQDILMIECQPSIIHTIQQNLDNMPSRERARHTKKNLVKSS